MQGRFRPFLRRPPFGVHYPVGVWKRRIVNAVLVAYLAVQLWLPLRVLGRESFYPSGRAGREYSWGMYARSFSYAARYRIVRKGSFTDVRPEDYFPGVGRFHQVLEHQRLARFNAWLAK